MDRCSATVVQPPWPQAGWLRGHQGRGQVQQAINSPGRTCRSATPALGRGRACQTACVPHTRATAGRPALAMRQCHPAGSMIHVQFSQETNHAPHRSMTSPIPRKEAPSSVTSTNPAPSRQAQPALRPAPRQRQPSGQPPGLPVCWRHESRRQAAGAKCAAVEGRPSAAGAADVGIGEEHLAHARRVLRGGWEGGKGGGHVCVCVRGGGAEEQGTATRPGRHTDTRGKGGRADGQASLAAGGQRWGHHLMHAAAGSSGGPLAWSQLSAGRGMTTSCSCPYLATSPFTSCAQGTAHTARAQ